MIHKGRAIYWYFQGEKIDEKIKQIIYIISALFFLMFSIVDINNSESIQLISCILVIITTIFILIRNLTDKSELTSLIDKKKYYVITTDLSEITNKPEDEDRILCAYLELKKTYLILNGYFYGDNYSFTKKCIKYEDILNIKTNFKSFCKIEFNIKNNLNEDRLLKLNLFNIYSLDRKSMIYIYNKVNFIKSYILNQC